MWIDDNPPSFSKKKADTSSHRYNLHVPHRFKEIVEGAFEAQNILPHEISWHERIQPYVDWVDWLAEENGGRKIKHIFRNEKKKK